MIGNSPAFARTRRSLERLARLPTPVLLRGETGTGKELAARLLHDASPRRERPFVAINCGAIPESLAESTLFGHVRGAFTGAHRSHDGAFVRAHGGTLFLDEVAELPTPLQAKLLRVLETSKVGPVGSEHEVDVDVRIVSATHRDLDAMISSGELREDVYHRLSVLIVELPALRERREDIPALIEHFAALASDELGFPVRVHDDAVAAALLYPWHGNVRALRNAVYRGAALTAGDVRRADLVPGRSERTTIDAAPSEARDGRGLQPPNVDEPSFVSVPRGSYRAMRHALLATIVAEEGSIRRAARVLDVPRSTLGTWLKH